MTKWKTQVWGGASKMLTNATGHYCGIKSFLLWRISAPTCMVLWMDEILHHLRNRGVPCKYQRTMAAHNFQVVRNGFCPSQYGGGSMPPRNSAGQVASFGQVPQALLEPLPLVFTTENFPLKASLEESRTHLPKADLLTFWLSHFGPFLVQVPKG